jgi:hypothetical protein
VLLAVTEGDPKGQPEKVFPKAILECGLHQQRSWYDLRGARYCYRLPGSPAKNFDDERVRLATDLIGPELAGSIRPIWFRNQRRRRILTVLEGIILLALVLGATWKGIQLSTRLDALQFDNDRLRLRALDTLLRWYHYSPEQIAALTLRDNPEQVFRVLVGGCSAETGPDITDQVRRVSLALVNARGDARGPVLVALNHQARVAGPRAEYGAPRGTMDIWEILTPLGKRSSEQLKVPREGAKDGFIILRQPLWGDAVNTNAVAMLSVFEAFERAEAVGVGRIPTAGELRRAYRMGLVPLSAEWCRFDLGTQAKPCEVCRMTNGRLTPVYPFPRFHEAAPKAAVRVVLDNLTGGN